MSFPSDVHNDGAYSKKPGEVMTGTTIMAASFDGGVILGADSRTSTGNYVANRATDKITQLSGNIWICRSGSAADTQNISMYVQAMLDQHQMEAGRAATIQLAANLVRNIAYENKEMLQAGMIVAGWDSVRGGQVYGVPLGGTLLRVPYTIGGSGSAYITGWCDKRWRDGMSRGECREFVIRAVAHAMARDGSSGGCIRLVTVTKDGPEKEFIPGEHVPVVGQGDMAPPNGKPVLV
ncbi:unnamed protein product [Pedinophyceae sp. YPF-701]|nr:unnamed protein product [Pedinophyceae sp. YPF-701]